MQDGLEGNSLRRRRLRITPADVAFGRQDARKRSGASFWVRRSAPNRPTTTWQISASKRSAPFGGGQRWRH